MWTRVKAGAVAMMVLSCGTGCREAKGLNAWVETTAKLKTKAQEVAGSTPYRSEQQEALKAYFAQVNGMANRLKDDRDFAGKFSEVVGKSDLPSVCGKVFLPKVEWGLIVESCTQNGFFLCAEEVKAYGETVLAIRSHLSAEMKRRFDGTPGCAAAM